MTAEIATPVDADPSSLVDRASESLFGPAGRFAVLNVDRYSEEIRMQRTSSRCPTKALHTKRACCGTYRHGLGGPAA